ncbi:hypothetical protein ILYODFUR_027340 [Ilyodon furcidens]|uniref:Uncharacterized protein n=1 Tax=Ilyodon furcidens TaxID=33524 RepID=A0ABV0SQE9_9TELE
MPEAGYSTGTVPMPAGYYSVGSFMPGYDGGSQQAGAARPSLPDAKSKIAPQAFEEASTDTQGQSSSAFGPPLPPPAPALQSGETSNVMKEAELGNFHQQTGVWLSSYGACSGFSTCSSKSWCVGLPPSLPFPLPLP